MMFTEKQKDVLKDLQTQEKLCIEKYGHYEIKQFWVRCDQLDYYFVFIV